MEWASRKEIKQAWQRRSRKKIALDPTCLLYLWKNHHIISKLDTNKTDYQKCPLCNVADGTSFKRSEQASLAKKESKKEASDDCIGGALFPCELVRFACCCSEESRASLCKGLLDNLEGNVGRNHTKTLGINQILRNQKGWVWSRKGQNLDYLRFEWSLKSNS